MKRKRTIETGRPELDDATIARLKPPFSTLMQRIAIHNPIAAKRVARIRLAGIGLAGIAATIALLFFLQGLFNPDGGSDEPVFDENMLAQQLPPGPPITPPEPDLIPYEYFPVNPAKGAVLTTKKGSQITIPPDAFAFADGTPCDEEVNVRFAEFHNALEIFLSGIPMQYDSAGITYTFESAGMFDIMAYHEGNSLILADEKEIHVDLVSNAPEPFNFYYFDTTNNRWSYMYTETADNIRPGPSAPAAPMPETPQPPRAQQQAPAPEPPPVPFNRQSDGTFAFKVDFDENRFPELAQYRDVMFEIPINEENRRYLRGKWDSVAVTETLANAYEITFFRLKGSITIEATPVLSETAYREALARYRSEEEMRSELARQNRARAQTLGSTNPMQDRAMMAWAHTRGASIRNLGAWNWDIPVPEPMMAVKGKGQFYTTDGERLNPGLIYLAQKEVNILWSYRRTQPWQFSGNQQNILWFILPDGQYALVSDDTLKQKSGQLIARIVNRETAFKEIERFI
jgi:hypothetical protein